MKQRLYMLWSACGISLCLVTATSTVQAQSIQIDGTTPTTPGTCTGSCNIGGGLQRGSNLFHSFSQFNVDKGAEVLFVDPGVTNILTRVTGNQGSNILGTLGVSGGNANLFLINPNGIIFGEHAKLQVGGSFVGTTANAIQFGNQGFFRASVSEVPLLTVNPSALFYQSANGVIENRSIASAGVDSTNADVFGLRVPDGRSLLLVGGEVNLNGGRLNAFGGLVELGGLAEPGVIGLDFDNNLRLSFPENTALANVSLTNGARVDVTANGGGSITVNAGNIGISGDTTRLLSGINPGIIGGKAGDIKLNATGAVTVTNDSRILNRVRLEAEGDGGDIYIKAGSFSLTNGGQVQATTFGKGNAGNVTINVGSTVTVADKSSLNNSSSLDSSVGETGIGNGGKIEITARELDIRDGGFVNTGTYGRGDAGKIIVHVSDLVSLKSVSESGIFSNVSEGAVGNGGEINITTRSLSLSGGSQIGASVIGKTQENLGGRGNGGEIIVNASDSVTISGSSPETGFSSGLFTATEPDAEGLGGNITIDTRHFRITDGGIVNSQTLNQSNAGSITINATTFEAINGGQVITTASNSGNAGNITVNASDSITLSGSDPTFAERSAKFQEENRVQNEGATSGLFASTRPGSTGSGGNIAIATQQLIVQDEAQVSVSSNGKGDAGNLDVNTRNISLDKKGKLTSETALGNGGNIALQVQDLLLMRRDSQITTNAGGNGDGGNITINAPNGFIVAPPLENSDITANANSGSGGKIIITTKKIFGFLTRTVADVQRLDPKETNPNNLRTNDITAFSRQNPSLSGIIQINSPDVDPSKGLVQLPLNLVDASQQIVADCNSGGKIGRSSFIVTGRGGLVSDPTEPLIADDAVLVDWITLSPESQNHADGIQKRGVVQTQRNTEEKLQKVNSVNEPTQIVEAQGWVIDSNGNVVLVAQVPTETPHKSSLTPKFCAANWFQSP